MKVRSIYSMDRGYFDNNFKVIGLYGRSAIVQCLHNDVFLTSQSNDNDFVELDKDSIYLIDFDVRLTFVVMTTIKDITNNKKRYMNE